MRVSSFSLGEVSASSSSSSSQASTLSDEAFIALSPMRRYLLLRDSITDRSIFGDLRVPTSLPSELHTVLGWPQEPKREITPVSVGCALVTGSAFASSMIAPADPMLIPRSTEVSYTKLAVGTGAVVAVGVGGYLTYSSYQAFAVNMEKGILGAYQSIGNHESSLEELNRSVDALSAQLSESYFRGAYCSLQRANYVKLQIAKGIAYDSSSNFIVSRKAYEEALEYAEDPFCREQLHYLYARSFRLSQERQEILFHLDQISAESPIRLLVDTERRHLNFIDRDGVYDDVFDNEGVPGIFLCPLSEEILVDPVFYYRGAKKYVLERSYIERCIDMRSECPYTRTPLSRADLHEDSELALAIRYWRELKLKPANR